MKLLKKLFNWLFARKNVLYYITASEALPKPLTADEECATLQSLSRGDRKAKSTLIERNLRLVVYIARKFENTGSVLRRPRDWFHDCRFCRGHARRHAVRSGGARSSGA